MLRPLEDLLSERRSPLAKKSTKKSKSSKKSKKTTKKKSPSMASEPLVILDDAPTPKPKPPAKATKLAVRNNSKFITAVTLDTRDERGRREEITWGPRGRDDIRQLTHAQIASRKVQKLMSLKPPVLEIRR